MHALIEEAVALVEYFPAGQPMHSVLLTEYNPAPHGVQLAAPANDVVPGAQSLHFDEPEPENVPAPQFRQLLEETAPGTVEYLPATH